MLYLLTIAALGVSLAAPPQRIVSTAPSITEMLFALGAGERVVGVTTYCRYPEEARAKPKIGGYTSPNVEAIVRQRPDLVVVLDDRIDLPPKLKPFGVPTLAIRHQRLADIERSIMTLAASLSIEERGRELVASIRRGLARVTSSVSALPQPSVMFVVGRSPGSLSELHVVGAGGYLDELITLAGGRNIFRDAATAYPKISLEEVLARDPDVIIDMSHQEGVSARDVQAIRALWSRLPSLRAVSRGGVHVVTQDVFVVPGPRVTTAVRDLARMFHGTRLR